MKKILCILLVLSSLVCAVSIPASAVFGSGVATLAKGVYL